MITVFIPSLTRHDTLKNLIDSLFLGTIVPDQIVIHDNSTTRQITKSMVDYQDRYKNLIIQPQDENILSKSWNYALTQYADYVIISNDDIIVEPNTLETLLTYAQSHPEAGFLASESGANPWSFFLQRRWLFDAVGPYDIRFKPAYFEDNDYHYRMKLLGYDYILVPKVRVNHYDEGSATIKSLELNEQIQHHRSFRKNEAYYKMKWGGNPTNEIYRIPFDGLVL